MSASVEGGVFGESMLKPPDSAPPTVCRIDGARLSEDTDFLRDACHERVEVRRFVGICGHSLYWPPLAPAARWWTPRPATMTWRCDGCEADIEAVKSAHGGGRRRCRRCRGLSAACLVCGGSMPDGSVRQTCTDACYFRLRGDVGRRALRQHQNTGGGKRVSKETILTILALDLGTRTGWALCEQGCVESGVEVFEVKRGDSPGMRYVAFNRWLDVIGRVHLSPAVGAPELIVYELPHLRGGAATTVLAGFQTRVEEFCARHAIDHASVHSQTLKKFTTGRGNAGKAEMIDSVQARFTTKRGITHDEADAIALLHYARAELLPPAATAT